MSDQSGSLPGWLKEKSYLLTVALLGLVLIVAGVVAMSLLVRGNRDQPGIELIESQATGEVYVDVGGAVENPGLYKLSESARVNDALVVAGGLSLEADRNWVTQTLNLAAKVKDGDKIYIPFKGETISDEPAGSEPAGKKININTASVAELDTLWGVGPATAQKIIDNRPYASVEEVLTKKAVKQNVYDAIKDEISVY